MDFDTILDKWENRKDRGKGSSGDFGDKPSKKNDTATPADSGKSAFGEDVLSQYLPGSEIVAGKDKEDIPPVSEGRSIWLRRPIQDTLDLHGLNGTEAREALGGFIRSMRRRKLRKALVIHGKGLHSPDGSVLAPLVREYMEMSVEIGEFGRAGRRDGGSGATWFILRQRSR